MTQDTSRKYSTCTNANRYNTNRVKCMLANL